MKKKILLVEDQQDYISLVSLELEKEGYGLTVAYLLAEARKKIVQSKPDLIILDIELPDGSGLDFCRELRSKRETAHTPILILTVKSSDADKIIGLKLGADDYLTKPFNPGELLARIEAILRRTRVEEEKGKVLKSGTLSVDIDTRKVLAGKKDIRLNPKEFDLLCLLMTKKGKVLNRTFLTESVWGYEYLGTSRTIDFHIAQLRKKLKNHSSKIKTFKGVGYRFEDK